MKTKINLNIHCGPKKGFRRYLAAASLLVSVALLGQNLRAADVIWTGGAGNLGTAWLTSANWSPVGVPGSSANAVFNGTSLSNFCYIDMGAAGNAAGRLDHLNRKSGSLHDHRK